ncbi:PRC-barrel domain-containing protein [Terracoccus luteus]|jgi:sporulation protein YlmC with PRC-barrel domain|uniref:PRC-barrel domain protein n=1 Tax=Terracoccus luteus TaxID=53356 RepID=A0A495Y0V0_9MICO|nr:PRC-barrel domain-containing protein [Terracoccus luteus]MBB2985153.1 sporulation protein YlmC with PRC-barrel domain [Terracoccus luteus]MCP2170805.1 sporulation protein YlmC with PRC-barrel domain [Terracoccus luteus]RKT77588.1 PRC-barrel domain protein [Terracoccus luteus]
MLFSQARKHKIVSTTSAETVGRVSGFVVDPATRAVVALEVKKNKEGDTLAWRDVAGFGPDAVTVGSPGSIRHADDEVAALQGKKHAVLGKQVLSSDGDRLGEVTDVDFDPETGRLVSVLVDKNPVDAARLLGVGSFAVVVRAQAAVA